MCPQLFAVLVASVLGQAEPAQPAASTDVAAPVAAVTPEAAVPESGTTGHWLCDWFGPMPQTCYEPRYGCYPGNARFTNRYPAFHGSYYRAPYNYRHLYEYPWHAAPHEPLPFEGQDAAISEQAVPLTSRNQPVLAPRPTEARPRTAATPSLTR